jgi:hypothetical protein
MLKAHLIKSFGFEKIYYKDNPKRTISLENCISIIFTNEKSPLRVNLEKIIELRNTSTHFITTEYEMVYVPLFQACVLNFNEKFFEFHSVDLTEIVPQNFLSLSVSMKALNESEIVAKYPEEIAEKLILTASALNEMVSENNSSFAINVRHQHFITKDKSKATTIIGIDNTSDTKVKIIKEIKSPNDTHRYTVKKCIEGICGKLEKSGVALKYNGAEVKFNKYHFDLFCKYYNIKGNEKFCYTNTIYEKPTYSYSYQAIDFIANEIRNDPDGIVQTIKQLLKNKKKLTPGAKEF